MFSAAVRDLLDRLRGRPLRQRRFPPNRWTPAEVERRIAGEPVEWGYVFGPDGIQIARRRGTRATLSFAGDEAALRDALVIHNHPVAPGDLPDILTFSMLDLAFAVSYDVAELRVIAARWRYILKRPPSGWHGDEQILIGRYREINEAVIIELVAALADGRISVSERVNRQRHIVLQRLEEEGWLQYRMERR